MTADEFVAALREITGDNAIADDVRAWGTITRRPTPLFEHPPDPVLGLLARYDVQDGQLLHMYYKADYPAATGLSSGQFLDVLAVYAHLIAASAEQPSGRPDHALLDEYAQQAAAVSPHATGLDWFWESRRP